MRPSAHLAVVVQITNWWMIHLSFFLKTFVVTGAMATEHPATLLTLEVGDEQLGAVAKEQSVNLSAENDDDEVQILNVVEVAS